MKKLLFCTNQQITSPVQRERRPMIRKVEGGTSLNLSNHSLIFSGAAAYGRPSTISTMANTRMSNFISINQYLD